MKYLCLQNLDSLVMLPMGCGEQNLAKLAPNIFALKYMNALSYTNNKLKETALKNIRKGKSCYDILYFIVQQSFLIQAILQLTMN